MQVCLENCPEGGGPGTLHWRGVTEGLPCDSWPLLRRSAQKRPPGRMKGALDELLVEGRVPSEFSGEGDLRGQWPECLGLAGSFLGLVQDFHESATCLPS